MIKSAIQFIKAEKKFAILCLVVLATYTLVAFMGKPSETLQTQPVLQAADETASQPASVKRGDAKSELESLEKLLKENPSAANLLKAILFCVSGVFTLGLIVNLSMLFNPGWRQSWSLGVYDVDTTDWKPSMLLKVSVFFLAASFAVNLTLLSLQRFLIPSMTMNFIMLFQTTVMNILGLVFMISVVRQNGGRIKDLGFRIPPRGFFSEVIMGIVGYLSVFPIFVCVLIFLAYVAHLFAYQPPAHPLVNILLEEEQRSPFLIGYSVLLATVIAPFLEEVFFRGFCYTLFKKKMGAGAAMVLSSLVFAAIHENMFAFWPIFILGMALAYVYEKRGSLIAPIVLHLFHNSTFIFYFFLAKEAITPT